MDRGAWQSTTHGVTELDMTERLTLSLFRGLEMIDQMYSSIRSMFIIV